MRKRILVTGGAGYIGDAVVQYILEDGHTPIVLDKLIYGGSYMRPVQFVGGDITDYKLMHDVIKGYDIDSVVHLAAIVGDGACAVNSPHTIEVNQKATEVLAYQCMETNTRLIFASTCSVYGANNDVLNEDSPTNPLSLYAGTKLQAEHFIRDSLEHNHVIFRLGTLYGLSAEHGRIRSDLVANILTYRAVHGETLKVHGGEQWRPLLHVKQAAYEFAMAATRDKYDTGTYILSEKNYTIDGLATRIVEIIGTGSIENTPRKFEDLRNYKVDASKAKSAGFSPFRKLEGGIRQMAGAIKDGRIADVWSPEFNNAKYTRENDKYRTGNN